LLNIKEDIFEMNVQVENLENNMARLTVEVEATELDKALNAVYNRQKNRISIPGFRKGKVPRAMVEKMYGKDVFYEDAGDLLVRQQYPKAYDEVDLEIVSSPEVEVVQIEQGKPFIFTAEVALKPEVTLGKYNGITVTKIDTTVSDEELENAIKSELSKDGRIVTVDRAAEMGDTVTIDFDGSIDGVPFEGGKSEGYKLELGSHSFIDNFEDQLVGKKDGDEVDVNVTFPEDYHEASLAGKPALFKVKVHEVTTRELPELDDELAEDKGFDSVDAFKEDIKNHLQETKESQAKRTKEDEALAKIVKDSKMDIPDAMVETQVRSMINDYAGSMMQSGLSFDQYLQFTGMTLEQFEDHLRPDALERIKTSLCLEQIAKEEGLEATDEDVDAKIKEMAETYGMDAKELAANVPESEKKGMKSEIAMEKAIEFVMSNVKERAKAKKKADKEAASEE